MALNANRLRSALTMLGVIIGVASVILMLAIGEGSRKKVEASISSLGSNQLIVLSGAAGNAGIRGTAGSLPNLSFEDVSAVNELSSVAVAAPVQSIPVQAVFGANNKATTVTGTTPAYMRINNMALTAGVPFSELDVRTAANVAIIGATVATELFGHDNPVGQTIRLQRQNFEIVGLLKAKGQGFGGGDQDDVIILPVTTAQRKLSGTVFPNTVSMIMLESSMPDQKGYTEQEVTRLLRQRHRIQAAGENDFSVRDVSALTETLKLTSRILSVLLGAIAFISLLVGGIGIMNIMLVSVTERTREIGLRMALGSRRSGILRQFLLEAVFLSFSGAMIGLLTGVGVGGLVQMTGALTPIYSASSILASVGVAIAVGVGFGYWPAMQASKLQPVEALRQQ